MQTNDDEAAKLMPNYSKWSEYKRGCEIGGKFRTRRAGLVEMEKVVAALKLPERTIKQKVVKGLVLAGIQECSTQGDADLYSFFDGFNGNDYGAWLGFYHTEPLLLFEVILGKYSHRGWSAE